MLFQLGMNAVLLIVGVVLFVLVKSILARVFLVIGWLLLIAIANIAFDKLFRKKDANGNGIPDENETPWNVTYAASNGGSLNGNTSEQVLDGMKRLYHIANMVK